jgi:hypothetical protein
MPTVRQPHSSALAVEFGNAADVGTNGTGWFVGFSEWVKAEPHALRYVPARLSRLVSA